MRGGDLMKVRSNTGNVMLSADVAIENNIRKAIANDTSLEYKGNSFLNVGHLYNFVKDHTSLFIVLDACLDEILDTIQLGERPSTGEFVLHPYETVKKRREFLGFTFKMEQLDEDSYKYIVEF